jgi:hypothetical protein
MEIFSDISPNARFSKLIVISSIGFKARKTSPLQGISGQASAWPFLRLVPPSAIVMRF